MAVGPSGGGMISSSGVLLDTSAWIAFLSPAGHSELKSAVQSALQEERVHVCQVVASELLVGTRDRSAYDRLASLLDALPRAPIDDDVWRRAADLGFSLRREGCSIPLPDLLIAEACRGYSLALWHLDQHFEEISHQTGLQTRSFLEQG
jgi:predicted nucleic acid-binding protein